MMDVIAEHSTPKTRVNAFMTRRPGDPSREDPQVKYAGDGRVVGDDHK
jgi:hypothetical protein